VKILLIGSGGREHALAWKLAQSARVREIHVAPGNAGTATEAKCRNVPIAADDVDALLGYARREGVTLTVVGPEAPLVAGVVDRFQAAGLRIFGPTAAAAQLEGSKAYAKDFLHRCGIPTAAHATFEDLPAALAHIASRPVPMVVKADGLAAGKGVVIAHTHDEAAAAARVVIEDFLQGEEASFIVLAAGTQVLALASSQDHKARDDGDRGPNTGGMGAYSPAPVVTPAVHERVMREVIRPTLAGLAAAGIPYCGFLYAGLMIGPDGASRVLEFNCRLGDPETQPLLMRLKSDLLDLFDAALDGRLDAAQADWDPRPALGVVLAAPGYPGPYAKGARLARLPAGALVDLKVFHAGTALERGQVVASGGRVVCVTGLGADVADARRRVYALTEALRFPGAHFRRDIGARALAPR
jgi:phosphoribosylamine---glycine ligase